MIRVVLADDHEIYREGLKLALTTDSEIEVSGEARNGSELVELVSLLKPDVVITDINMPVMDGIEAINRIVRNSPNVGILAISMLNQDLLILEAFEAGALGYLLKNAGKQDVINAVKTVDKHHVYYCTAFSPRLLRMLANSPRFNPYIGKKPLRFNDNEINIIQYICQELNSKEIAEKLGLSIRTVEGYRMKILEKIEVKTTAGIAIYAIKNGIFKIS